MIGKIKRLLFVVCAVFCVSALSASIGLMNNGEIRAMAQETAATTVADGIAIRGASIRYRQTGADQGLRFSLSVTDDYYTQLQTKTNVKIGMLVMPYDLCGGKLTIENTEAINEVFYSAAEGADTVDRLNEITDPDAGEENYKEALLVLKDIPNLSYNRRVCAVGYIEENGAYTYTSVKDTSIAKVAKAAKSNETNADRIADLENYLLNYTVKFYDWNGDLLTNGTQSVKYGENFTVPEVDNDYGWYTATGKNGDVISWSSSKYDFTADGARETLGNMYFKVDNRKRVTLTGSYEYGSGRYDAVSGKFVNDGDNVTVKVGGVEAVVDKGNQTYTIENVIAGEYDITVESDYFRAVTLTAVEANGNTQPEKVILKSPKMAGETGFTYGKNGVVTVAGDSATIFKGNTETAAGEGFVVKYVVNNNNNAAWFNRGGLHVTTSATERNEHDFGLVSTGKVWGVYAKQSGVDDRDNLSLLFADFDVKDEWKVTVVYYDGVYYMSYESTDGTKKYTTGYLAQSFAYVDGSAIVSKEVTRKMGLSSYCSEKYATIFSDVSYAIGDEIAKEELKNIPNPEFDFKVSAGTRVALPNAVAKSGEGFVINYTVKNNGSTIEKNRGGLYMIIDGTGKYRFDMHKTTGFYVGDSNTADKYDYYTKNSTGGTIDIGSGDWNITIAFYNGAYYLKFTQGETAYTKKIDSSFTGGGTTAENRKAIYSATATRELWLHSFTTGNAASTEFSKITYSIGNDSATAAIAAMGFQN